MITRYCPKCGRQITLDNSQPFGFCTYCGTRIEPDAQPEVAASAASPLDAYIEQQENAAQAFIKLGQWKNAHDLMDKLTQEHPESGLAWLAYGMIFAMPPQQLLVHNLFQYGYSMPPFTAEGITDWLEATYPMNSARRILRENEMPLYRQKVDAYRNSLKEQLRRSECMIDRFIQNPMSLAGYIYYRSGNRGGFFEDGNSLYYADMSDVVKRVYRHMEDEKGKLIFELVYTSNGGVSRGQNSFNRKNIIQRMRNEPQYREFRPLFVDESTIYMLVNGPKLQLNKTEAEEQLKKRWNAYVSARIKAKQCPICGSDKTLFGKCSIDCMSLFKR